MIPCHKGMKVSGWSIANPAGSGICPEMTAVSRLYVGTHGVQATVLTSREVLFLFQLQKRGNSKSEYFNMAIKINYSRYSRTI